MKILITGAASGIGLGCVKAFAQHQVTGIDRTEVDLSHICEVQKYCETLESFDAMIYCAGVREIEEPTALSYSMWEKVLNVNVNANFLISQKLIKNALAKNQKLSIINISSVSGFQAEPNRAAYVTAKHAVIGLSRQLGFQYARQGVRVNVIAPGIIETPMTASYFKDSMMAQKICTAIPTGKWGQVENLTPLIENCLHNEYLNGSVLVCDGGWTIGRDL